MKKILLVEDDSDYCEALSEEMNSFRSDIWISKFAHSISEAEQVIENGLKEFKAIIVDLNLPESAGDPSQVIGGGVGLIRILRTRWRYRGVIIVLTGSQSFADGREAFKAGCDAYLCKGRDIHDLVDCICFCVQEKGMVMSPDMRHLFLPEEVSAKEARLLDMLLEDRSWPEIAKALGYKNAHAASSTADRIFDKLLTWHDAHSLEEARQTKRQLALQLWRFRHRNQADGFFITVDRPIGSAHRPHES